MYYVYTHSDLDGNVFYIGKGTKQRAWSDRGYEQDYIVDIPFDNLTEEEALDCEALLIQLYGIDNLRNKKNETPKLNSLPYYRILQNIKDIEVLLSIDDTTLQNKFIKEQVETLTFIENLTNEYL